MELLCFHLHKGLVTEQGYAFVTDDEWNGKKDTMITSSVTKKRSEHFY